MQNKHTQPSFLIKNRQVNLSVFLYFRTIFVVVAYLVNVWGERLFSYANLLEEIQRFNDYGVETGDIGTSELGQRIPYIFLGDKSAKQMIVQGSIHAREHLTALLVVYLAKYLLKNKDKKLLGGIYFVPMVNPDGVRLCQEGVGFLKNKQRKSNLIAINRGNTDFSLWKANVNGVDLNVNFDADWAKGKNNVFTKSSENFVGKTPFSESESIALKEFTQKIKPIVTLSYHLKGEIIFWQFDQNPRNEFRDRKFARALAKETGYQLVEKNQSCGGYKDWCISKLKIPSFTIEVGDDKYSHPFPYHQFEKIFEQNKDIPRKLLNSVIMYFNRLEQTSFMND